MAPTMTLQTECVAFHGDQVLTVKKDNKVFVAVKPISDALGLNWVGQYKKLTEHAKTPIVDNYNPPTPDNGGASPDKVSRYSAELVPMHFGNQVQNMLCIPLEKMNGWLFSIHPDRVKPEVRSKVVAYQEECFAVLHSYWHKGSAVRTAQGVAAAPEVRAPRVGGFADDADDLFSQVHGGAGAKPSLIAAMRAANPNHGRDDGFERFEIVEAQVRMINREVDARVRAVLNDLKGDAAHVARRCLCERFMVNGVRELRNQDYLKALDFLDELRWSDVVALALRRVISRAERGC